MLTFVPLLWIAVSGTDATILQCLPRKTNVPSLPRPGSPAMTRRLNIFESFAKSADQRGDALQLSADVVKPDQGSLDSDDEKSVNEILQRSLVELRVIIDAAKSHLIFTESVESLIVFQSLLRLLSIPRECDSPSRWQNYLIASIRNLKCSVKDLCHEFSSNFKCDHEGRLKLIAICGMGPFDHLNLLMIPSTVEKLSMQRCGLTSISAWSDLKGKSLKSLRIYESQVGNLKLNLDGLQATLDYLPLENLTVGKYQISEYFGLQTFDRWPHSGLSKIGKWMKCSTLLNLRAATSLCRSQAGRRQKCFCFCRDGTCVFQACSFLVANDQLGIPKM